MAQEQSRRSTLWVWVLVALALIIALIFIVRINRSRLLVGSVQVQYEDIVTNEPTNGKVEPLQDFQAHAPLAGVLQDVFVDLDQKVKAGQELARMDATEARKELATAEAGLQSAQATLHAMQQGGTQDERLTSSNDLTTAKTQAQHDEATLASLQKLQAQGAASANEVAVAKQHLADDQTRIAELQTRTTKRYASDDIQTQQAQVAQAMASVEAARAAYSNIDIHAPFAGTVYAISYAKYDFVPAGDLIVAVADLTKLQVTAYFDEPEVGALKSGQPVTIVWDAKPGRVWHGHVVQAPTTITNYQGTRNVGECLISVDDATGDLLPNTNVTVTVTTASKLHVLSLPREALHTDGPANFVYKIVDDRLVRTPVQVGVLNLTRVEITSGLTPGDHVALGETPEADLTEGLRVKEKP